MNLNLILFRCWSAPAAWAERASRHAGIPAATITTPIVFRLPRAEDVRTVFSTADSSTPRATGLPLQVAQVHVNGIYIIGRSGDVGEGHWLPPCSERANQGAVAMPIHRLLENHAFGP